MRLLGVGSRFSILAPTVAMLGGILACLGACSSSEASAKAEGVALTSEGAADAKSGEPEQGVRQMRASLAPGPAPRTPSDGEAVAGEPVAGEPVAGEPVVREARALAAGVSRASGALAPRVGSVETITSKHLEAELNRLEAELAN